MRIRPFDGYLVRPDVAERVVAPPRGKLTRSELDGRREREPLSILNVVRSGSGVPPERLAEHRLASARRLRELLRRGIFEPLAAPRYVVYRASDAHRSVTGLVAELPVAAYEQGRLKPHERLRDDQVARMADHLDAVGASSLPVTVGYRSAPDLDDIVREVTGGAPVVEVAPGGAPQTMWLVPADRHDDVERAFATVDDVYIADGHHRVEAVRQVAERRRQGSGTLDPEAPHEHLLALVVAIHRLHTAPYHRWVRAPAPPDVTDLPDRLREHGFEVTAAGGDPVEPTELGTFGMLLDGTWFRIGTPDGGSSSPGPGRTAVEVLHARILRPLLGVHDPDADPRLGFVPGAEGVDGLVDRCRREGGIGFTVAPTPVDTVLAAADAGDVMPPKSTWFVPKPCSGMLLRLIEGLAGPGAPTAPDDGDVGIGT